VAKVGTSKAGGTISQQAVAHPWLATDAEQTNKTTTELIHSGNSTVGKSRILCFFKVSLSLPLVKC
jgi:hypothetical protein